MLIREGRLRPLTDPRAIELVKRPDHHTAARSGGPGRHDPRSPREPEVARPEPHPAAPARPPPHARRPLRALPTTPRAGGRPGLRWLDWRSRGQCWSSASPVLALMCVAVLRSARPAVLYRGPRVGRGGGIFDDVKLRALRRRPSSASATTTGADAADREEQTPSGASCAPPTRRAAAALERAARRHGIVGPRPIRPILRGAHRSDTPRTGSASSSAPASPASPSCASPAKDPRRQVGPRPRVPRRPLVSSLYVHVIVAHPAAPHRPPPAGHRRRPAA